MTGRRLPAADDGVAALEMALVLPMLLAILGLVAPLAVLFHERVQLGRTAGDVIRFATSRAEGPRTAGGVRIGPGELPASRAGAVPAEARRVWSGRSTLGATTVHPRTADPGCQSGWRRSVTLTTTVDLGPFLGLIPGADTKSLTATATSCEE